MVTPWLQLGYIRKAPIYKGSEGLSYNNTIKKVKLFTNIKVKIIIENIVLVVWLYGL